MRVVNRAFEQALHATAERGIAPHAVARAEFLLRSQGPWGLLPRRTAVNALAPLFKHDRLVLINHYIDHAERDRTLESGAGSISGEVVETADELDRRRPQFHPELEYDAIRAFVDRPGHFVSLGRYESADGTVQYVTCHRCEHARFEAWHETGISGPLPPNYVLIESMDTVPEFRGRGANGRVRTGLFNYFETIGVDRTVCAIHAHNRASRRAHLKPSTGVSTSIAGFLTRVTLLGRVVQQTPWRQTLEQIVAPPDRYALE